MSRKMWAKMLSGEGKKIQAKLFKLENVILVFGAGDLVCFDELECPFGLKCCNQTRPCTNPCWDVLYAGKCPFESIYPSMQKNKVALEHSKIKNT